MPERREFGGQIFAFSAVDGATDWRDGLIGRVGYDHLELKLPVPGGVLRFSAPIDGIYGDCFTAGETRAALLDAHNLVIEGEVELADIPAAYRWEKRGRRTVLAVQNYFSPAGFTADLPTLYAARRKYVDEHCPFADRVGKRAISQLKTMLASPCGILTGLWTTPDRWPHRNMWLWDSVFHALALRHLEPDLAKVAIRAVFLGQEESSGFIPHYATPDGRSTTTQPPVLGYGAAKIWEEDDDAEFLAEIYPKNQKFLAWCAKFRGIDETGLLEYLVEDRPNCRCAESGMDNSPRFDRATRLQAVDFNAFYSRECQLMEKFALRLGKASEAANWRAAAERLNARINRRLWNEKAGLYCDFDLGQGRPAELLTSAGFLPLICGAPTQEQAEKMVKLLRDPEKFGTTLPIPSVARDAETFSTDMWRGPVWVNINLLICEGLTDYGYGELAAEIMDKTWRTVEKYFQLYGTFFEYYDADDRLAPPRLYRKGKNDPDSVYNQPLRDYGWTAALYADHRFRQIWPKKKITRANSGDPQLQ